MILQTHKMIMTYICISLIIIPSFALAGTNTGCSGDQWGYEDKNRNISAWVYHTHDLWKIGFSGFVKPDISDFPKHDACGIEVSTRSENSNFVSMHNGTCTYHFDAKKAVLTVKDAVRANCQCKGEYTMKKTCSIDEVWVKP